MSKSKDIRSFFSISPKTGAQKPPIKTNGISDTKKKKRRIIESDSDEEPSSPVVKKSKQNDDKKKPETSKYFAASAADVFGSEPVKRVSRSPIKKSKSKEMTIEEHDDAEFEAALLQLDTESEWIDKKLKENGEPSKSAESPKRSAASPSKSAKNEDSKKDKSPGKKSAESPSKSPAKKEDSKKDKVSPKKVDKSPAKTSPKKEESGKDKSSPSKSEASKKVESNVRNKSESPKKDAKKEESPARKDVSSPVKKLDVSKNSPELKARSKLQAFAKSESKSKPDTTKEPDVKKTKTEENKVSESKSAVPAASPDKPKMTILSESSTSVPINDQLWVEKYKPTSVKQIVGQQGPKSCVAKLTHWLKNWHSNQFGGKKLVRPSPWAKDDDGAYFRAALLSGRPGIGKTTTAHLVCKELGFDIVEFNASDTRSKKLLHQEVTELLTSKSLNPYFTGGNAVTSKHCLVMDEVDGMAGNEDRGGMQELIQLIKTAKVPIICMCNDRSHPKMRSLLNYCFDLSFTRPRIEQLRGAMMSICFKEKLKLPKDVLDNIITNCEQDIRLILNHLSMLAANKLSDLEAIKKHVKLGPWDVLRKVFSAEDHKTMSIHDKSDLFFHDYSIAPLFVQENYLNVVPRIPETAKKSKRMALFAEAAESISYGDLTDKILRSTNSWSLLPTQAMFASVIPGTILEGYIGRQINFPAWLGKNSRRNKLDRFLQEIHQHTRLRVSGSKQAINLDYLVPLRDLILQPLIKNGSEGVPQTLSALQTYDLVKEDLESILELSQWPNKKDPMTLIESKVKAALTRAYNKVGPACPYAIPSIKKGSKRGASDDLDELAAEEGDGEEVDDDEEKDDVQEDAMIVVKKPTAKKGGAEKASTSKAETSKGKGRGGVARGGKRGKK